MSHPFTSGLSDDAGATSSKKRISRWVWIGGGCLSVMVLVIAVAIAVPVIFFSRWFAEGERQLEEEVAILASISEPSTPQELEAYYRLPAGVVDTTHLWMQAADSFDTDEFRRDAKPLPVVGLSEVPLAVPGQPWDELAGIRNLLDKYGAAMEQLHEASRQEGGARYEMHFEDGFAADSDIVQKLRVAGRMLKLEASFSLLLTPAHDALFGATGSAVANRDGAIVILAIERYRARTGQLPDVLSELVPEFIASIPIDPFDGQPLRYRVDPDRYVVYSIGEDRQDNGGDAGPNGRLDTVLFVVTTPDGGNHESSPLE